VWNGPQTGQVADGLVGRAVFAHAHAIVGEDEDDVQSRQRRQTNRRPHVIREGQEGRSIRQDGAVRGQSVRNGAHGMLSNSEVDVPTGVVASAAGLALENVSVFRGTGEVAGVFELGMRGRIQIRRAAHQRRYSRGDGSERFATRHARGHSLRVRRKAREIFVPVEGQVTADSLAQLAGEVGVGQGVCIE
jgi:hypothetical protein